MIDIAATCVVLSGASYPDGATPLEGLSLVPVFAGQPLNREALYWEHEGNRAVRAGKWKLVAKSGKPWELYDISQDRIEAKDLAESHPEKVEELARLYDAYAKRALVE